MDPARRTAPALGIANDPAGGVARRDRSRAGQAFARLQRDIGDLSWCGIDLIERAFRPGIDLDGVIVALAARLDAGGGIGVLDAPAGVPAAVPPRATVQAGGV
jgi:hypothetical protein